VDHTQTQSINQSINQSSVMFRVA